SNVYFEIRVWILHAIYVTHLAREIEYQLVSLHQIGHAVLITDIGDVDMNFVFDPPDIEGVATVRRHQRVDQCHLCLELDQSSSNIASDEAKAARHQDFLSGEVFDVTDPHKMSKGISNFEFE